MTEKKRLPLDLLGSVAEFTPLSHAAKFSKKETKYLFDRERKTFEDSLPRLMKVFGPQLYESHIVDFWRAGKYLDLLPEIVEYIIMENGNLDSIPNFIIFTNYNDWFTTNRLDFLEFMKYLYGKTNSLLVAHVLMNMYTPKNEKADTFGRLILYMVKEGKILYDPIYLELYLRLGGKTLAPEIEDLKNFPIIKAPPSEYKNEKLDIKEAYNFLLYRIFEDLDEKKLFIFENLIKYELPFYDLEIDEFKLENTDYLIKTLKSYDKKSIKFKFILKNLRDYLNRADNTEDYTSAEVAKIASALIDLLL